MSVSVGRPAREYGDRVRGNQHRVRQWRAGTQKRPRATAVDGRRDSATSAVGTRP